MSLRPLFLIVLLCAASVEFSPVARAAAPLPVVVSIAPQKYLVDRIGGNAVSVSALVAPNADPHTYEPTPAQMRLCADAAIYFTIGVPFEDAWLPRIAGSAKNLRAVSTIKGITRLASQDDDDHVADTNRKGTDAHKEAYASGAEHHHHDGEDPHVWLSPMLVRTMLPHIVRALSAILPEQADTFRANADTLAAELENLDEELAERFRNIPESRRIFLTFHPAWRYFALNYQLKELSIEIDGKEPGPKAIKEVIDTAREHGITTVFIEPQFPKAIAIAIANNIGATLVEVNPLAENLPANLRSVGEALAISFEKKP